MKFSLLSIALITGLTLDFCRPANAQFSLIGQLRTRTELRNGVGNLPVKDSPMAAFTSQRARLTFGYKWDRVTFSVAVQDVRVWGQDASSISNSDGNRLMVHEAWADLTLLNRADSTIATKAIDYLSLKIGRQELVYDDVRLLGNLDWLQQGRRFDAALLKAQHKGWVLDLGLGFNQNTDAFGVAGTYYTPTNVPTSALSTQNVTLSVPAGFIPTSGKGGAPIVANAVSTNGQNQQFKSFQMAYLTRKFKSTKFSALVFKDDFQKYRIDSIGTSAMGYVYGRRYDQSGTNSRVTYGAMLTGQAGKTTPVLWQVFAYGQSGRDRDGLQLKNAYHYGGNVMFQRGVFSVGPGYEVLSGNDDARIKSGETSRFDPLYGTPHRHWGYMDYFYVGTGSPSGGLQDAFLKFKYAGKRLTTTFDVHYFALAATTFNKMPDAAPATPISSKLGVEYDLIATYALNKFTTLEGGYAIMNGTNTLEYTKQGTMNQKDKIGTWAYLMINIRPDFLAEKK
ncbi:alginate export family protein [Spirosoma sp. BT702]|uniref:Alginate export family protein n=1 Tax=Spirosoma profusum TaxID=2771354 RepID=A0A926XZ88_9BACT|nr:alginate export family protein [Spirosoma profusum]MBD2703658.1 alginate export family protein [Spirosoma profusum]